MSSPFPSAGGAAVVPASRVARHGGRAAWAIVVLMLLFTAAWMRTPPASAAPVHEPVLYGRVDVAGMTHPRLVYSEPIVVRRTRAARSDPVYLHVPPGHAKHWSKHCHKYGACDRPVYFVDTTWYNDVYAPAKRGKGKHRGAD